MKEKALKKKLKAHYVRKKQFEALKAEVNILRKAVSRLDKCCAEVAAKELKPKRAAPKKAAAKKAPATRAKRSGDDLKKIKGIGTVLEGKLVKLGITRFSQIAAWNKADIDKVSKHLDFKGRIEREDWIKQAAALAPK